MAEKRKPGPKPGNGKKTAAVCYRIAADLKYKLAMAANKAGESQTQFVERAIEARIEGKV